MQNVDFLMRRLIFEIVDLEGTRAIMLYKQQKKVLISLSFSAADLQLIYFVIWKKLGFLMKQLMHALHT